ncbi:GH92 family glycosyl hydrolase [Micromonosporaceae bacterium Da 78-11]
MRLVLAAAVVLAGIPFVPSAAAAAPAEGADRPAFQSSFEQADPQPQTSTPFGEQKNVSGQIPPGSLSAYVTAVSASAENPPGEAASRLLDGNANTKWLAFATTAEIVYRFDRPVVATGYAMTSADDEPGRDPSKWTVEGSTDGTSWTLLDTRTEQKFSTRRQELTYQATGTTAYTSYRLSITANNGAPITQLADWDLRDGRTGEQPMLATVAGGPAGGLNSKAGVGFAGVRALRYGGKHVTDGPAAASDLLFADVHQRITARTELSYLIFPEGSSDLAVPASWVAVDLVLDDGTRLAAHPRLVDANGFGATARDHGKQKSLFENQWNAVHLDLGSLAGRTVEKVLVSYDYPTGKAGTVFSGWLDDLRIGAGPAAVDGSNRANYVDTRRGTLSSSSLSRGTNVPATAWPNGFNFFTPMTDGGSQGTLYEYQRANNAANLPTLEAIGISHEPSIWMGDRDQLGIMPSLSATPTGDLDARALPFRHTDEIARPDLYGVKFQNGLTTEVTPTDHGGIYRFGFPGTTGSVVVDRVGGSASLAVAPDGTVSGWVDGGNGSGISRMFVHGAFDTTPTAVGVATGGRADARYASFTTTPGQTVLLRLATSFISLDQARKNLDLEVTGKSFAQVNQAATAAWNDRLDVIDVEGATPNQQVSLYSSLYRMNLYPNSQFENTGTAAAPRYQHASPVAPQTGAATDTTTNAKIVDGKIYVNNGFWDTYRTVWPLYNLLYPKLAAELVDGFVQQYREGGWIARWSSPGYSDIMTGTSSDVAFADAYLNGALPTATALEAYDAALKNATVLPPANNVGRKSLDRSIFLGYTPDSQGESVSWGLEGYINDHGIGLMAAKLAKDRRTPVARRDTLAEESAYFLDRAQNYVQMFDDKTGFFRPKTAAGAVAGGANFDPTAWWGPYTETNAWNFAFHAPFDIDGLASLYGGSPGLVKKLDEFFATPETGGGGNIHEMIEARAVRMGQLGMSNQPSHHIPYLYAAAGEPSRTQAAVREIEQRLFVGSEVGQGYLGDEDNGEMSSWYLFSALGFYPLSLGSGEYTIGSPLFTKSTVHLENGRDLVVNAPDNAVDRPYIRSATLNGKTLRTAALPVKDLTDGGRIDFRMSATPTGWAQHTTAAQPRPNPDTDATKAGYGVLSVSDASTIAPLTDDTSRTATTFATATPAITWKSTGGAVAVDAYTLTSGSSGNAPTSWRLEGSADGIRWKTLDTRSAQTFAWPTQTRPFQVGKPKPFTSYRLTIEGSTTGTPVTLAELELLVRPGTVGDLAVTPAAGLRAKVGTSLATPLATVSGGRGGTAHYTATADFADGTGPQPATLSRTPLGTQTLLAEHTFAESGEYSVAVTVSDGKAKVSTLVPVSVVRDESLTGAFNSTCIGDPGVGADCDAGNWAFHRQLLADSGFVQGRTVEVPGTDLSFDLPAATPGGNDNATGAGQTIRLDLGTGATQLSVIGTATQAAQHTTGILRYRDGSTDTVPIDYGDWAGTVDSPIAGNIVVGKSAGRLSGAAGSDDLTIALFSTAPFTIAAGKTPVSLQLPTQTGDAKSVGRIHVFAIASNGTRPSRTALSATGVAVAAQKARSAFTAKLATADGGMPSDGTAYTARINWGDGTAVQPATVTPGKDGLADITGNHRYVERGDYTVAVTVDDTVTSAVATTSVHVN